jgi:hypothetical protein
MFLEIVNPKNNTNSADNPDADAIAELKQDLESLYSEIPSVAQMAAEQEYLRPVIKEVENGKKKASEGLQVGGAYVSISFSRQYQNRGKYSRLLIPRFVTC